MIDVRNPPKRLLVASILLLMLMTSCMTSTGVADQAENVNRRTSVAAAEPTSPPQPTTAPTTAPTSTPVPVVPTPTVRPLSPPVPTPLPTPTPTATPIPTATPVRAEASDSDHSGLAGTHGLTLQWIGWEPHEFGEIEFLPLVDGTYLVSGEQIGWTGDTLFIDGVISRINDRELLFDGTIIVDVALVGGRCERSGEQVFLASGDRQFWRMRDFQHCEDAGRTVTDYVDIYFGPPPAV